MTPQWCTPVSPAGQGRNANAVIFQWPFNEALAQGSNTRLNAWLSKEKNGDA
ncbi:hypothetical protein VIC_001278 [Vibrio coralliilyticus ATCC BAA-450]|nr:hypothetical protein VIC_001278 [Vibrio coralliilyticus ATCC BAA-450]